MGALNGQKVLGSVLSVNVSKPKEKEENKGKSKKKKVPVEKLSESSRIFVKNVDKDADSDEIRKVFEVHGEVKDVYNPGKGFIFVSYSKSTEAEKAAKAMDGEDLLGKSIQCNIA